jgi:hypothetical protein
MINEAMVDYHRDLQAKEAEIGRLRQQLQVLQQTPRQGEGEEEEIKIEEHRNSSREEELEIIQE